MKLIRRSTRTSRRRRMRRIRRRRRRIFKNFCIPEYGAMLLVRFPEELCTSKSAPMEKKALFEKLNIYYNIRRICQ